MTTVSGQDRSALLLVVGPAKNNRLVLFQTLLSTTGLNYLFLFEAKIGTKNANIIYTCLKTMVGTSNYGMYSMHYMVAVLLESPLFHSADLDIPLNR